MNISISVYVCSDQETANRHNPDARMGDQMIRLSFDDAYDVFDVEFAFSPPPGSVKQETISTPTSPPPAPQQMPSVIAMMDTACVSELVGEGRKSDAPTTGRRRGRPTTTSGLSEADAKVRSYTSTI